MDWKKAGGLITTFVIFAALFTGGFYLSKDYFQEEKAYAAEPETEAMEAMSADSGSQDVETRDTAKSGGDGKRSKIWTVILGIFLLSFVSTFLSWTVVDKVMKGGEEVAVVSLQEERGKKMMQALSNDTRRQILDLVTREQMTASDIADEMDMSIQSVQYNLKKLREADLVVSDHYKYSPKGKEMKLYRAAKKYFVIGSEE